MSPQELFNEARLADALTAQATIVAAKPDDVAAQLLLCEMLAYTGDFRRVRRQLQTIRTADPALQDYLEGWQQIVIADEARHTEQEPSFLIEPPPHIARRFGIVTRMAAGEEDDAIDELDTLDESLPWLEGHVDGRTFDGLRDADDFLAPLLEVFHADEYVWVPWEQVRKLRLADEDVLRDRLYRPAQLWLQDASQWEVLIPTLYSGTGSRAEDGIQIGAGTDWIEAGPFMRGIGGKTLLIGEEELLFGEFRQIEIRG